MQLSKRQVASLRRVWSDLALELDAGDIPETDDAACRDGLDSWLAGVISSDGRVDDSALENLLDLERGTAGDSKAAAYLARVTAVVMPYRDALLGRAPLVAVVKEHCFKRGYRLRDRTPDRPGDMAWTIEVPSREGQVDLALSGDLFELTFPGGYLWIEFAYEPEDEREALDEQLRILDAFADPATTIVTIKRALRRPRTELHLSDGTRMWRGRRSFGGASRPRA